MSESANQTVLTGPGQGVISDGNGVAWSINESGSVVASGSVDADPTPVVQIVFVNNFIWRQHASDLRWSCKQNPGDPWSNPTHVSPLPGTATTDSEMVDAFTTGNNSVLSAIAAFRSDVDGWIAKQPPAPTPTQIAASITELKADMDGRENAISGQISALSTLVTSLVTGQTVMSNAAATDQTTLVALLDQIITEQTAAASSSSAMAFSDASNQTVLVNQLNAIQAAMTANQTILVAALTQLVDVSTGPTGLVPIQQAIATLQQDFTNLTVTLNSVAEGISEKLQQILLLDDPASNAAQTTTINTTATEVAEILADVEAILAIVKAEETPPPVQIVLDLEHFTTATQAVPSRQGP